MNELIELLRNNESVNGYKITEKKTHSCELFFVHEKLETVRTTDTTDVTVTVYADHDGARGDSSFALTAATTKTELKEKIDLAVKRARLSFSPPYALPKGGVVPARELPSNLAMEDEKTTAAKIARAAFDAKRPDGGSINALEVFLYTDTVRVINSEGIDKTAIKRHAMVEAIPTYTDENDSVELYDDHYFTLFDEEAFKKEISEKLFEVYERRLAVKPPVPLTVNVLLRPAEIRELLEALIEDRNYATIFAHANLYSVGDDLQKDGAGDKLTLTCRAATPGSVNSAFFDGDGTDLTDVTLIKDGVIVSDYGGDRFGQYLGVKRPTGELRCMKLEPGTLTEEELRNAPHIECASLSGIQIDPYNDYIGGEIRLGYCFDGKTTVPVSGITMSGKLSEALKALRLSAETKISGCYEGPGLMLLPGFTVL